jgi:anti-sigma factor RsiW
MSQCTISQQLGLYLDGELDARGRATVERHLQECAPCRAELADLSAISRLIAQAPQPRLSQISLHRLHARTDAVMEEGLVRLARIMQAVAASVLIAGSAWLMRAAPVTQTPAQASVATVIPAAWDTRTEETATPAAAFYLADASSQTTTADDLP